MTDDEFKSEPRGAGRIDAAAHPAPAELWNARVGHGKGIFVSVQAQRVFLIENAVVRREYPCSTAALGVGNRMGSNQTPTGWHEIRRRFGLGAPVGAVFKSRVWTGAIWSADAWPPATPESAAAGTGDATQARPEDLILTRILWLSGLEEGINKGGQVDTYDRYIYIHGTNDEASLGRPASHGCVRMGNRDVLDLFDRVAEGCKVLIQ